MALSLDASNYLAGASGTSASVSLTCSNSGDVIFLVATLNGPQINSITSTGATFTLRKKLVAGSGSSALLEVWTGYASGTFNETITCNFSGSASYATLHIFGINGAPSSAYFDTDAGLPYNLQYPTSPCDPVTLTSTANANDIIIGAFRETSTASPTAGSGFTQIRGVGYTNTEYKIVSATQSSLSVGQTTGSGDSNAGYADAVISASAPDTLFSQCCL